MSFLTIFIFIIGIIWFFEWLSKKDKKTITVVKKIGKVLLCITLVIVGLIILLTLNEMWFREWKNEYEMSKVEMTVEYNTERCPESFPLLVSIQNSSRKTVNFIKYKVVIRRKGYSTDISYLLDTTTDKIIEPGKSIESCHIYFLAGLYEWYNSPNDLEFEIGNKRIIFAK